MPPVPTLSNFTLTHRQGAPLYVTLLVTTHISTLNLRLDLIYNDAPFLSPLRLGQKSPTW
ncbi:MAG UNVERIFIED_CONTAM: hypothetical protein LVT10_24875 [Anaerolineae bacterium]